MSDGIKIGVDVTGAQQGVDALSGVKDKLTEIREEARKVFAKGLSESLPEQLGDIAKGFEIAGDKTASFTTRLQGGVGAALIAKTAVSDLVGRMVELTRAFGEATAIQEQQQRALRALGSEYAAVRDATAGTVTATDGLAMRQTLLRAGFEANADTLARVSRLGREYAQTYGGTATQAVEQFVSAVHSGDANALQPFGVRIGQMKTSTERMAAAVDQLGERFSRVEAHARTATEENQAFERGLTTLRTGAVATLNVALGGTLTSFRNAAIAIGDYMTPQAGVADGADRAARSLEAQAAAARTTATATADLTSELTKADEALKAFENTLHDAPDYTLRANESYQEAVARNAAMALNAMNRARRTREVQAGVLRSLGRVNNVDRAAAGLPTLQAQHSNLTPKWLTVSLEEKAAAEQERLSLLSPDEHARMMRAKGIESEDSATSMLLGRDEYDRALRAKGIESDELTNAGLMGRNEYGTALQNKRNESAELESGNSFGGKLTNAFASTKTAAESAADSVKGSFDMMTSGLTSFMDTLIESPEKAGEASVNLAKGVLKGIGMMAAQNSLFELAAGFADLARGLPTAAGHFISSGIYAGVAVAAGAGAAGIAASQRGATQATPPSNSSSFGPARAGGGSSDGQRGGDTYIISVNGSILDEGGFERAVQNAARGLRGRGA